MKRLILSLAVFFSMLVAGQIAEARPSPPTGVNATDGTSPDYVGVSWVAVEGIPIYRAYRCSSLSASCSVLSYQTGTSFKDFGGRSNRVYFYRVQACEHLGSCSKRSDADAGHRGFVESASSVGGRMDVAENIFVDGDVNDPNVPEVSNDLVATPQILAAPSKPVGNAVANPTTFAGAESDEWDFFQLPLQSGETVILDVSDWNPDDPLSNDIDLYLINIDDTNTITDSSENATQTEWVSAPEDGIYIVGVHALSGTSNYLLRSGQSTPLGAPKLSSSTHMAEGELIAAIRLQHNLNSASGQNEFITRIQMFEKENALSRIKESAKAAFCMRSILQG